MACDTSADPQLTSVSPVPTPSESTASPPAREVSPAEPTTPTTAEPTTPPSIERYQILDELGSGGMGTVFKTRREGIDKTLAIKKLHARFAADEASKKRFQQEAKAASLLTHANLVSVYDYGMSSQGEPYLVMDCIDGKSLGEVIKETNGLTARRFISIFMQVCDAMSHAHAKQVIHRDLKPNNILLTKTDDEIDVVKIVDFGIAKLMPEAETTEQKVTQTGDVIGSPVYMSPEQCVGSNVDGRSDIYSIGCVMYEALMGEPSFLGENVVQTILQHLNDLPVPFAIKRPDLDVPAAIEAIVFRCLEKTPSARYQSFDELKDALELVADTTSVARKKLIEKRLSQAKIARWLRSNGTKTKALLMITTLLVAVSAALYTHSADEAALQNAIDDAQQALLIGKGELAYNKLTFAANQAAKLHKPNKYIADIYLKQSQINRSADAASNFHDHLANLEQARKYLRHSAAVMDRLWVLETMQDIIVSPSMHAPGLTASYMKQLRHEASQFIKEHKYKQAFEKLKILSDGAMMPKVSEQIARICLDAAEQQPSLDTLRMFQDFHSFDVYGNDNDPRDAKFFQTYDSLVDRLIGDHHSSAVHKQLAEQAFVDGDYPVTIVEMAIADGVNKRDRVKGVLDAQASHSLPTVNALQDYSTQLQGQDISDLTHIDTAKLVTLADVLKEKTDFEQQIGKINARYSDQNGDVKSPVENSSETNFMVEADLEQLGDVQLLLGQYEDAKLTFERLALLPDTRAAALPGMALALGHQNKWQAAETTVLPFFQEEPLDTVPAAGELRSWFRYCKQTGHESIARQERQIIAERYKGVCHRPRAFFSTGSNEESLDDSPDKDQ